MKKLLSAIFAATLATVSAGAFAASHGGAMSDKEKEDKMAACKKMDPMKADDKMKAECKKMMEEKPAPMTEEKKKY
jgi:hypothetical protein